jgi:hypothetical protein
MSVFQRMIEIAKQADDIWIGTRSDAVKYILACVPHAGQRERVAQTVHR